MYLLVVWGGFRYYFNLPPVIEELWIKPVIWLVPLFWWNLSFVKRVTFFGNKTIKSVFFGLVLGCFYILITGLWKRQELISLDVVGVALATAAVEELALNGFLLGYLLKNNNDFIFPLTTVAFFSAILRLPILFFGYKLGGVGIIAVLLFTFASSILNGYIRVVTKNVLGSIVARTLLNIGSLV